ncbi:MAG TPA: NTP transferase domain-containing protein [Thermoanaerobaculia bacterium]|nr:NTP transferase domain-containing protein [Thermoanaerobaculia bacterium]
MKRTAALLGIVLAGGASRRMGRDKAGVELGGETLAAGAARRLAAVCPEVALADRGRGLVPGLLSFPDGPGRGPAAGLLGAARAHPGRPLLALACDLPRVPVPLLAELAGAAEGADWVLPRWRQGPEPLCAIWGPRALAVLADRVARGVYALWSLAEDADLAVRWLEGDRLAAFGDPEEMFFNVNTPEELETARKLRPGSL